MRTCQVEGCGAKHNAKGFCLEHYRQFRPKSPCCEKLCIGVAVSWGLCATHYKRFKRQGRTPAAREKICHAKNCARPHSAKGLCVAHYNRLLKHGNINETEPIKLMGEYGTGHVTPDGYRTIQRLGHPNASRSGAIQEHRWVVAEYLGRPLRPEETVHHRNGNRLHNTVGPCILRSRCDCAEYHNLELWSKSHPSGQRISDKLRWAAELIEIYGLPV